MFFEAFNNSLELLSQKRGSWGYFEYEQKNNLKAAIFAKGLLDNVLWSV